MNRTLGALLLVAGTCIGAGMLALPITSAASGFFLSILLLIVCWLFAYYSGLLVMEVNLWLDGEPSYISMAKKTLGRFGQTVTWLSFLLLLYSLLAAYFSGGGSLLAHMLNALLHLPKVDEATAISNHVTTTFQLTTQSSAIPWLIAFSTIIFLGAHIVDLCNRLLVTGLVISFILLCFIGIPHINIELLKSLHWAYVLSALPVLLASFGYHIVIPSVRHYLHGNAYRIKQTIFYGSVFTLMVYALWELVVFGNLPLQGDNGLLDILHSSDQVAHLIKAMSDLLHTAWIGTCAALFAFFALASSFLGVAYGLFDLLADGLNIPKTKTGRVILAALTFIPPLLYAWFYPNGFVRALGYAGVFVAILHGILPIVMVWKGRAMHAINLNGNYKNVNDDHNFHNKKISYQAPGGKLLLIISFVFFILVIFADIAANLHWIEMGPRT